MPRLRDSTVLVDVGGGAWDVTVWRGSLRQVLPDAGALAPGPPLPPDAHFAYVAGLDGRPPLGFCAPGSASDCPTCCRPRRPPDRLALLRQAAWNAS